MSTNFPPIHICLEEAIADLNKLGRNLQSKVDSLKRKRFTPEKLRGRYGYTNISRKLFTICDLSRKSIENVENKVRKSIKTYDNDRRCDSELPCNDLTGARVGLPSGVTLDHYSSCVVEILNKEKYVVDEYKNISSDDSNAEKPPKKKKKVAFSDKLTYIDDLSDGAMQDSENSRHSNGDINGRIKSDKTSTKSKYKENYARLEKSNGIDEADDSSCELVETSNLNNENEKETSEKSANTSEINKCETLKTESKGFIKCVDISKLIASPKHNRIESEVIVLDTPSPKLEKITKQCYTDCKVKIETLEDSDVSSNETKKKRSYERVRRKLTSETERKKTDRSDDSSHAKSGNSRHRDDRQKDRRHGRIDSSNNDKSKSDDAVKSTKDGENPAKKLRLNKDDSAKSKSNESPRSTKRTPPSSNRRKFVLDSDDSVKSNSDDATKNNDKKSKKPQSDNDETVISKSNDERSQSDTGDSGKLKLDNATKSTPSKNKLTRRKALSDSDDNLKSNSNEAAKDNDPTQTDSNDNRNSTKTDAATKEDEVLVERESTPSKKGPKLTRRKALSDSDDSLKSNSNEAAKVNEQTQSESNESGKSTKTDAATKEDEVLVEQESTQLKNGLKPKRGKSSSDSNDNVKSTSNKTATDDDQMSDAEESGKSKSNNNKVTNEDELVPQKSTQSKKRLQLTRRSDSEDSVKSNSNVAAEDDERTQSDSEDSVKSNSNEAAEDDDQTQSNCETAEDAERSKSDDNAISKSNHAIKEDELLVERKSTPSKKRLQLIRRKSLSDSEDSAKSKSNVDAENDERMDSDDATKEDELLIERKLTPSKKGLQLVRGKQLSDSDDSVKTNSNEVAKNDEGTQSDADVSVKPKSDNTPNEDDLLIMRNATLSIKELLSGSDDNGKSKRKSQTHVSPKSDRQSARRKLLPSSDDNVVSDDNAKDVDLQIDLSDLQIDKVKKEILSNTHVASVQITPFSSLRTLMKEYKLSRITKCGRTIMKQSVSSDACAKQSLLVNSSTESERSSENVSADDSDSDIMKELSQTRRKMLKKRAKNTANSADTDSDIDNDQKQLKSDLTPDEQSEEMGRSQRIKTRTQTSNNEKSDSSAGSKGKDSDINRMANLNNLNKQNRPKDSRSSDSGPDKAKKRKTNNLPKEVEENGIDDVELEEDEPSSDNCMVEESFELAKESDKNKTAANGGTDAAELAKMELLDSNETDDEQTEEKEKKKKTKSVKEPEDSSSSDTKSRAVKKSKGRPVDKLLTGKLSEDSTSDDNKKATDESSDNIRKTKKKSKTVIGSDSDNDSEKKKKEDSDSQSSNKSEDESKHSTNSGSEDDFKPNRRKARKKTKGSSDESSDESKKGKKKRSRIKKRAEDSDESGAGSDSEDDDGGKKGRKNIRRVLGKGDLEETTIRAEKEERLRRQRIADRQKQYNSVMFDESGKPEDAVVDKVVLDFDPDTKEPIIEIDRGIVKKLKPHQANGIKFMWDACFESVKQIEKRKGSGCILAHCMGLGKTLQVIALIHTLLKYSDLTKTRRVLVVCPLSTVLNWVNEFKLWLKFAKDKDDIPIYEISRYKQNHERAYQLQEWIEEGGVCVLGYEMFRNLSADNTKKFKKKMLKSFQESLVDPGPDMVICDEGHLLKNEKTSLSQSMNRITTRRRIVLTGTPLQNNLKEYYCMVQFVKPNLLGKYNEYLNRFVNPITNGQYTDSTDHDIRIMKRRSHVLHKLLDGAVQRRDYGVLAPFLPPKQEYVVFITVTEVQAILYQHYLDNYSRRPHPDRKNSGFLFPDFQALQRIWTHPLVMKANSERYEQLQQKKRDKEEEEDTEGSLADFLDDDSDADTSEEETSSSSSDSLSDASDNSKKKKKKEKKANKDAAAKNRSTRANPVQKDSEDAGKGDDDEVVEVETKAENPTEWWMPIVGDLDLEDLALSNKLVLLFDILRQCEAIGDKVLVFSQSLYSLDLIEHFLSKIDEATQKDVVNEKLCGHTGSWSEGLDYFRLDGQTSCENRSIWCKSFNKPSNPRARLFLISTRAGGLGINLVAANRVIIFDVSWNPSHDVQSIFRIYRFGQKKPCYIYRFLAMGTMEEKIYERQVTKQAISKRVIDEQQIDRHYAENDLAELYIFTPEPEEPRPTPSLPKDRLFAEMIKNYEKLIYKYHEHDSMLENKEEETLTEEERKAAWDDFENEKNKPPPVANFPNMMMPMMNMGHDGLGNTGQMSLVVNHMMGLIRKDNPTLSEQQLSAMIPILFSRASQMDQSKMNPMYYQQNQHVSPNMMPGLSGVHGAMPGLGGYSWQQQQQLANMQRIQQQQQQAAMGMKFYAGGLGSRDPVSMAEAQIRNREMSSGGSELPRRGRPPITARPIISADVVDVEDSE